MFVSKETQKHNAYMICPLCFQSMCSSNPNQNRQSLKKKKTIQQDSNNIMIKMTVQLILLINLELNSL